MILRAAWLVVAAIILARPVHAETVRALASVNPAPNNERRVALVIGNSAYKSSPLRNPVNDARAIAHALTETGFNVTLIEDGTQAGMRRAIRTFGDELLRGGVGLFYYAGHGMQVRGKNYLVPVNADIQREDEVEDQAVDANLMLSKMDTAKNSLNLMILDACRNNPFQRSFRSSAQGLAQMDAPSGTLIAFATAPGSVAADGEGENGTYTKHLLEQIRKPGTPVEQLFKQVRNGVMADTKERQVPWESSSLRGDFFFLVLPPGVQAEEQKRQQQQVIEKAVGDAVRQSEERAVRERAELQEQMKKLVAEMLAKQRAELESDLKARGAATPASVASAPAAAAPQPARTPAQAASVAPSPAASPGRSPFPAEGDRWEYAGWQARAPAKKGRTIIEVKAVLGEGVLESRRSAVRPGEWVYKPVVEIVGNGSPSVYNFSPYLLSFQSPKVGDSWLDVPFQRLGSCSRHPSWHCKFDVRVVAAEKVTVPAGTFDTLRVEIEQTVIAGGAGVRRLATFWYSAAVKRPVKYSWKTVSGTWDADDVVSELVSYTLN